LILILLLHLPLLLLDLPHKAFIEFFLGWVHFLSGFFCLFCHFLLFKEILRLLIDLFYLCLDSFVLILPYVSLLFPHVSLLVHVGLDVLFALFLFSLLYLEGIDDLYLQFLGIFGFEFFVAAKFHFLLAFVFCYHIIFFFLVVIELL
jgi:hypothetical protein